MNKRAHFLSFSLIGLCLIALIIGAVGAKSSWADEILTGAEIKKLLEGRTAEAIYAKQGGRGLFYFQPNGVFKQIKDNWQEEGQWKVNKKGRLCLQFAGEKKRCRMLVSRTEGKVDQYIAKKDGNHRFVLRYNKIVKGDKLNQLGNTNHVLRERLSRKSIIKLFSGNTVESKTVRKGRVSLSYYFPDGRLIITRQGKRYQGAWRVSDRDRMCLRLEGSKEKCRIVVKQGNEFSKYIVKKNGDHQKSIIYRKFLSGNRL